MSITTDMNGIYTGNVQSSDTIAARAQLVLGLHQITQINARIQEIVDGGSFATISIPVKNAMLATWNVLKAAQTALEDPTTDIPELLNWTKP